MRSFVLTTWLGLACAAPGCAEEPATASDVASSDASVDAAADGIGDATGDAPADTLADTQADTSAAPDLDALAEVSADSAAGDAAADALADATPDAAALDVGTDASADASPDTSADLGPDTAIEGVQCTGSNPKFPSFAIICSSDTDCFVGIHQLDCCGTKAAIGLATTQQAAFSAAEALCAQQFPKCKCLQQPTMAEDGYTTADSGFKAVCQAGLCTAVTPNAASECLSTGLNWPKPVKICANKADCTYVLRTVDCCGSQLATGILKSAKDAYEVKEVQCATAMAICDCMAKPVAMEDGSSGGDGLIAVDCLQGNCSTYAKP